MGNEKRSRTVHQSPACGSAYLLQVEMIPDCVGDGIVTELVVLGVFGVLDAFVVLDVFIVLDVLVVLDAFVVLDVLVMLDAFVVLDILVVVVFVDADVVVPLDVEDTPTQ
jgi:hypothetical protein